MILYDMRGNGDCLRACVETVLQCPGDVPDLVGLNGPWWKELVDWARERGLDPDAQRAERYTPPGYYIGIGPSPRHPDLGHAVVFLDGRMRHDPYESRKGITHIEHVISFTVSNMHLFSSWRKSLCDSPS